MDIANFSYLCQTKSPTRHFYLSASVSVIKHEAFGKSNNGNSNGTAMGMHIQLVLLKGPLLNADLPNNRHPRVICKAILRCCSACGDQSPLAPSLRILAQNWIGEEHLLRNPLANHQSSKLLVLAALAVLTVLVVLAAAEELLSFA